MTPDDMFPPDVLAELERQRHAERMEAIRKRAAIRDALRTEEFIVGLGRGGEHQ